MQEETPQSPLGQPNQPLERKKMLAVGLISLVIAGLAVGAIIMVATMGAKNVPSGSNNNTKESAAATLFYDALGNAAKQQQYRIAMYRATFANKTDADSGKNIGTEASSVAEIDNPIGKTRSVYATSVVDAPNFHMGRCLDGAAYGDNFRKGVNPHPTSLAETAELLRTNQKLYRLTETASFSACQKLGVSAFGVIDLASYRYSDGVFPVTFTDVQAENWKNKVKEAQLFTFKDEGMVEHDGKQLKKISFTPKDEQTVNATLQDIFQETGELEKIKREHPTAEVAYEFISIGTQNTGSVGGFYLFDEAAKLPVYSELYSTNPDKPLDRETSSELNIARTKQAYKFGAGLSLTFESPLEIVK